MGRLVPVSRFCLINGDNLHYSEGIKYSDYKEGGVDPSTAISFSSKKPKALWVDSEKRHWRLLTALLSFISIIEFDCHQIRLCLDRAREISKTSLGIWSGGLKISSNAGEQYVSGMGDFVDSSIFLPIEHLGKSWFEQLKSEMISLDQMSKELYSATLNFFKTQKMKGDSKAKAACNLYWQLCERNFKNILLSCNNPHEAKSMRKSIFVSCVNKTYDLFCPKDTARQLDAWAKNSPNPKKYLRN
jgi:CRISPR system Cascade subunit CasA